MQYLGVVLCGVTVLGLAGCDYWPPALQAQIEQMRSETQTLSMEKAQLQVQVNDLSKARQDLQTQLDELSRVNREKTEIITSLQRQVDALRAKTVKGTVSSKGPAKPAAKATVKQPVKKKAAPKR
jgi:outer membrane murein-binding lipoprotein Lpp